MFDDADAGLVQEQFVAGADSVIDCMVRSIPDAADGFTLIASERPFPGHQLELERRREENDGNSYCASDLEMEGWLCPALFKYFQTAPHRTYAQFKRKSD